MRAFVPGASGLTRRSDLCGVTGKVRWIGRSGAERERDVMARGEGRGSTLEAYQCKWCRDWHVGHARGVDQ